MHESSKLWAFFAYLFSIIGFILVYALKKHDRFAMYHAKQSLVLFIGGILIWVFTSIINHILFIGVIISSILNLLWGILWIIGLIYALSGQEKPLPIIGQFSQKINL